MKKINKLILASTAAVIFSPTATFAQSEELRLSLEEIVVTGLKREESLQELPISINEKSVAFLKLFLGEI